MNQMSRRYLFIAISVILLNQGAGAAEDGIFMKETASGTTELTNVPADSSYELLIIPDPTQKPADLAARSAASSAKPTDMPSAPLIANVSQYRELVDEVARHANVEARLLHAIIAVESAYNPQAISPKGAVGLMQLMPAMVRHLGIADAQDPLQNIRGGATYLRELLNKFSNDVSLALAAYNAGENAVLRHGSRIPPYRETTAYVSKVLAVYRKLEKVLI